MDIKRIVFVGVGGQGNLLSSRVLGEAALLAGLPVNVSEVHGMAQRGGVVESAVVLGGALSSIVSNGEADVLIGFEPSETLRALEKCSSETAVITNVTPLMPFTVAVGKGVYPDLKEALNLIRKKVKRLIALNADALAEEAGSAYGRQYRYAGGPGPKQHHSHYGRSNERSPQEKPQEKAVGHQSEGL